MEWAGRWLFKKNNETNHRQGLWGQALFHSILAKYCDLPEEWKEKGWGGTQVCVITTASPCGREGGARKGVREAARPPQAPGIFNKKEQGESETFCCPCSEKYTWQAPGRRISWRRARTSLMSPGCTPDPRVRGSQESVHGSLP